jgi:uncharacterized protein DUF4160
VPEIARFYGIVIRMFYSDHVPPHFHAFYSGAEAIIDFRRLFVIAGDLPPRALGMTFEWTSLHQDDLLRAWDLARQRQPLPAIDPLP